MHSASSLRLQRQRRSGARNGQTPRSSIRTKRTRSEGSLSSLDWNDNDESDASDGVGSLADFSIEGYTIDLAMLGRGGAGKIGVVNRPNIHKTSGMTEKPEMITAGREEGLKNGERNIHDAHKDMIEGDEALQVSIGDENDGPEDFTLNMGRWIKGGGKWPIVKDEQMLEGVPDEFGESLQEPLGTSTPMPLRIFTPTAKYQDATEGGEGANDERASEDVQTFSALRTEIEKLRREGEQKGNVHEQLKLENTELRRDKARLETQVQEHGPLFSATATGLSHSSPSQMRELDQPVEKFQERIETLESALKASHETLRHIRAETAEREESQRIITEGLREDVGKLRSERNEMSALFKKSEHDVLAKIKQIDEQSGIISKMTSEASSARVDLERTQAQLRETRRIVESVEAENDRFSSQNAGQVKDLAEMGNFLENKATELQAAHATIMKLREAAAQPMPKTGAQPRDNAVSGKDHKAAVKAIVERQEKALTSIKTRHEKEVQELKRNHDSQVRRLRTEAAKKADGDSEEELRSAVRALSSKLEKANAAARAARSDAGEAWRTAETRRQENEVVNAELESKFAEAVEEREREWRKRVGVLLRERDKMGKVLLHEWGREEIGEAHLMEGSERQAYRYRYVQR